MEWCNELERFLLESIELITSISKVENSTYKKAKIIIALEQKN